MRDFYVYLDTSLVSRIRDGRLQERDARALENLSEFSSRIHYVTSDVLTNEVARTKDSKTRGALLLFAAIIEKVPWVIPGFSGAAGDAPVGALAAGASSMHPVFAGLHDIFDQTDAHHIFLAVHAGCDYFLTVDRATIIRPAATQKTKVSALCGKTKIIDPPELWRDIAGELKPP